MNREEMKQIEWGWVRKEWMKKKTETKAMKENLTLNENTFSF